MFIEIFILFVMIFCHIVDDYYLQGCLANMKQKEWWEKNCPSSLYEKDYIIALLCHAFSWSFMTNLPITTYFILEKGYYSLEFLSILIINMLIHAFVDNLKANKKIISLLVDQMIHLTQILATWVIFIYIIY